MLNVRSESPASRRLVTVGPDGATGWSRPRFDPVLPEPICMGSIVRLSTAEDSDRNRLVFSNPHSLRRDAEGSKVAGGRGDRRNLSLKVSYVEGATWSTNRTLEPEWSAYSDLAVLPDGTVLCFYERGSARADGPRSGRLTLARVDLSWLTDGADELPRR